MCQQGGESYTHKNRDMRSFERDCICSGGIAFELILLDVLSLCLFWRVKLFFFDFSSLASGVEPVCLFLRASCVLLGCVEPLPMSLGTKFLPTVAHLK